MLWKLLAYVLIVFCFCFSQRSLPLNFVTLSRAHKLAEDALVQSVFADLLLALMGVNTLCYVGHYVPVLVSL